VARPLVASRVSPHGLCQEVDGHSGHSSLLILFPTGGRICIFVGSKKDAARASTGRPSEASGEAKPCALADVSS